MQPRKAKIAATLGPACDAVATLRAMLDAGVDVARINYSHGVHADHTRRIKRLRRIARGRPLTLLADLQGPRFRLGEIEGGGRELTAGERVVLTSGKRRTKDGALPVTLARLADSVSKGDRILIDDGRVRLRVTSVKGREIRCRCEVGGRVADRKGINLPDGAPGIPALTRKDRADLEHAVAAGADWLAVSFVRRASDIRSARRLLARAGRALPVMAKIERPEAIDDLDAIVAEADALLVARGDLGVELPPERVPVLQKQIISAANRAGKPVVTATQMLDSMRHSPRPTRAEASDVANAVFDGSGCLLLTAETAVGEYPVEAVSMMARIIEQAEASERPRPEPQDGDWSIAQATCLAAVRAGRAVDADHIVAFTTSGATALQLARFRPGLPILAFTPSEQTARRINLVWGVIPGTIRQRPSIDLRIREVDRELMRRGLAKKNDLVVVVAGHPAGTPGNTNLMTLHRVGDTLT